MRGKWNSVAFSPRGLLPGFSLSLYSLIVYSSTYTILLILLRSLRHLEFGGLIHSRDLIFDQMNDMSSFFRTFMSFSKIL